MFIVLTNASEGFEGRPVAIQSDLITSIYERNTAQPEEKAKYGTFLFSSATGQTWQVKEKVSAIVETVNGVESTNQKKVSQE